MSIFSIAKSLAFLTHQAFTAATHERTVRALDLSGLEEKLAEREAEMEFLEPQVDECDDLGCKCHPEPASSLHWPASETPLIDGSKSVCAECGGQPHAHTLNCPVEGLIRLSQDMRHGPPANQGFLSMAPECRCDTGRLDQVISILGQIHDQLTTSAVPVPLPADVAADARPRPTPDLGAAEQPNPRDVHKQALTRAMDEDRPRCDCNHYLLPPGSHRASCPNYYRKGDR